jgi:hypothetical protein
MLLLTQILIHSSFISFLLVFHHYYFFIIIFLSFSVNKIIIIIIKIKMVKNWVMTGNYLRLFFPFLFHFIGAWDAHQFWVVFISWWIFNFSDWGNHSKKFSSMNKGPFLTYSYYQGPYLLWKMNSFVKLYREWF